MRFGRITRSIKKRIHAAGWLVNEDLEILREASKRKLKYAKVPANKFKCIDCDYTWFYQSGKCPACENPTITKMI